MSKSFNDANRKVRTGQVLVKVRHQCRLLLVLVRSLLGKYTEHSVMKVRLPAMFWHFVDAVWVLMFVSLYLL